MRLPWAPMSKAWHEMASGTLAPPEARRLANRRPEYPLPDCVPAEPDSVSPGIKSVAHTFHVGQIPLDVGVMPRKIHPRRQCQSCALKPDEPKITLLQKHESGSERSGVDCQTSKSKRGAACFKRKTTPPDALSNPTGSLYSDNHEVDRAAFRADYDIAANRFRCARRSMVNRRRNGMTG